MKTTLGVAAGLTLLVAGAVASDEPRAGATATAGAKGAEIEEIVISQAARDGASERDGKASLAVTTEEGELRIIVEGGEVKAWLDGEEMEAEQLKFEDGQVLFLGENGEELVELDLAGDTRIFMTGETHGTTARIRGNAAPQGKRVMLGVVTAPPGEALAAQLGLDRGGSVLITQVLPDHPAVKAGVKQFDVIVKVDEESKVTTSRLRRIIQSKDAGDKVLLGLIRKAEPRKIVVELNAIGTDAGPQREREQARRWNAESERHRREGARERTRERRRDVERRLRTLREQREVGEALRRSLQEQVREHIHEEEALKKALKHLEEMDFDFDFQFDLDEQWNGEVFQEAQKKARRALEQAMKELKDADVQKRMRKAIEAVEGLDLEEHLGKLRLRLQPLEKELEELQGKFRLERDGDAQWRIEGLPEIEFLDENGRKGVVIVAPDDAEAPESGEEAGDRFEALERRLERLEKMLEKLIERGEGRSGDRRRNASEDSAPQA